MGEMILQVNHLSKSFGTHEVLRDIDFTVNKGDVTSIIGASGSGKSTLLRCINLLENPTSGEILYHGENVVRRGFNAAAYRSRVGMVFQSFNLFNNMTVLENCIVGQVKVLKKSREEAKQHRKEGGRFFLIALIVVVILGVLAWVIPNVVIPQIRFGDAYESDEVYGTPTMEDIAELQALLTYADRTPSARMEQLLRVGGLQPYHLLPDPAHVGKTGEDD